MKRKNGFTLIELLAVIIILGILMIIAIPSVTQYINNSRKSAYVDTAKEIVSGARNRVNQGDLEMFDTNATYYIPIEAIGTENGSKSPYGDFEEAYVVVTYNGNNYTYYWLSVDETGQGVKNITRADKLDEDDIESDIKTSEIIDKVTTVGIGNRTTIKILDSETNYKSWKADITLTSTSNNIPEEGASGNGGNTTPTAVSTILSTAQTAGQLNQIPDTNIYIFKGGDPANYVTFNGESWRIIGIYGNQLKIQRVTGIAGQVWNTTTQNPGWANSSLKTYLNETYYNTLSETAKGMIDENGSWNVGAVAVNAIASESYTGATTTSTVGSTTHTTPWTGKVGIMASYEFLYASSGENCLTTAGSSYNSSCGTITYDWMNPGYLSWSLSPYSDYTGNALLVNSNGRVDDYNVNFSSQALPAVILKSSVTIASGDGVSPSTAYILQ